MPTGPNGEKRPNSVTAAAVLVGKIATGEIEEKFTESVPSSKDKEFKKNDSPEKKSGVSNTEKH